MDKTLTIDIRHQDEMAALSLRGRLDTLGARKLEETLSAEFTPECRQVFLDMKEVVFLSSAGIRILIKYYKLCNEVSGELILQNVPQQAADVLKMVGLEKLMLEGNKPSKKPEKQTAVYDHIRLEWWKLHNESAAAIIYKKSDEQPLLSPGAYETLTGRAITEPSGQQTEFLSIGAHLFYESGEVPDIGIRSLYYTGSTGSPSHLFRFCCHPTSASLEEIITLILNVSECRCAGIAGFVRSAGLIGCRYGSRSETENYPISYSSRLLYPDDYLLLAGVVHQKEKDVFSSFTRPLSQNSPLAGHFHAAAIPGLAFDSEEMDLNRTLQHFQQSQATCRVFHLINDERPVDGGGQSLFYEGSLWLSMI